MKRAVMLALSVAASSAFVHAQTIMNPWSGVSGDKGNMTAFAFRADAGAFPDSITPAGSLGAQFLLSSITLFRPNDVTTPVFGTGIRQVTGASTPVFIDIYTGYDANAFSGYIGSSSSAVSWAETSADQPYSLLFPGIILQSNTKYWFVFSEDGVEGEISNFRAKLNTSGTDLTAGPGKGYLVTDPAQAVTQAGAMQDWAFAFTINPTVVPEPSIFALGLLGICGAYLARRGRRH